MRQSELLPITTNSHSHHTTAQTQKKSQPGLDNACLRIHWLICQEPHSPIEGALGHFHKTHKSIPFSPCMVLKCYATSSNTQEVPAEGPASMNNSRQEEKQMNNPHHNIYIQVGFSLREVDAITLHLQCSHIRCKKLRASIDLTLL